MTTTTDVLEGLRAMAGKSPGRKRQAAKPADDAGMDGVDVEGYEVRSHRKQALTLRAPR